MLCGTIEIICLFVFLILNSHDRSLWAANKTRNLASTIAYFSSWSCHRPNKNQTEPKSDKIQTKGQALPIQYPKELVKF